MRSSILLISALAMSVLARPRPHHRRRGDVVTEIDIVTTTVVVYVTVDDVEPVSTSSTTALQESLPAEVTIASTTATASSDSHVEPSTPVSAAQSVTDLSSVGVPSSTTPSATATPESQEDLDPEDRLYGPPGNGIWQWWTARTTYARPTPRPWGQTPSVEVVQAQPTPASPVPASPAAASPAPVSDAAASNDHVTGAQEAYLSSGSDYQAAILYHHNAARANHNAAPLTWDTTCESNARLAAQKCNFAHYIPQGANEGQNLFTVSGKVFNVTAGITESWYKSELPPMRPYFGKASIPDSVFHSVGHLTQMVWKGTTKVGCVSIDCGNKMIVGGSSSTMNHFTVCNYAPAGNIAGEYAVNVDAPDSLTNLGSWSD